MASQTPLGRWLFHHEVWTHWDSCIKDTIKLWKLQITHLFSGNCNKRLKWRTRTQLNDTEIGWIGWKYRALLSGTFRDYIKLFVIRNFIWETISLKPRTWTRWMRWYDQSNKIFQENEKSIEKAKKLLKEQFPGISPMW